MREIFSRSDWARRSGEVSIRMTRSIPSGSVNSMVAEVRVRLSRGSVDVQVAQSQAMTGTPAEVPVPKKRSCMGDCMSRGVACAQKMHHESIMVHWR